MANRMVTAAPKEHLDPRAIDRRTGIIPAMLLAALAAVLVHWPALSARAIFFDDDQYILQNQRVLHPTWSGAWAFMSEVLTPTTVGGYYQPLAMISLMMDGAMGGSAENLLPFHRTSLLLHGVNTALIVLLIWMLFGRPWIAAGVALLFAVHPMTVETMAWAGDRKTMLAAFFAIVSLIAYVRFCRSTARPSWAAYFGCLLAFICALLSKPTSTPLPLLLLVLDLWPLRRLSRRALLEKVPFFAIAALSSWVTVVSQRHTAMTVMPTEADPLKIPLTLAHNIAFYFGNMIFPLGLSSYYPFPTPFRPGNPVVLVRAIGGLLLIAGVLFSLRLTRSLFAGAMFFFLAILPTMQIIGFSNVIASDKYAYLPVVGLLISLAWGLDCLLKKRIASRTLVLIVVVTLGVEVFLARQYHAVWRDSETLYRHCVTHAPDVASLRTMLGGAYESRGADAEAEREYRKAYELRPDYPPGALSLGRILEGRGAISEARLIYEDLASRRPYLKSAKAGLDRTSRPYSGGAGP